LPPRTDLALEAHEEIQTLHPRLPGVETKEVHRTHVKITRVFIKDDLAASLLGKPPGKYVTLEVPRIRERDHDVAEEAARSLADELAELLPPEEEASFLVAGLGNWHATADSLGPKVVSRLLVTRHLPEHVPADLRGGLRSVCALSPGVLGLTGIETMEILEGVVERVKPRAVICVDALAARQVSRILTTIQVADTGIQPGSGVGNYRRGLDRESLGVPVIAIGVPTVVHASVIAREALAPAGHESLSPALEIRFGDLMVTPKEIDLMIDELADIVAAGLNAAFHPRLREKSHLLSPV